jgi:uncharacterized protein YkwD
MDFAIAGHTTCSETLDMSAAALIIAVTFAAEVDLGRTAGLIVDQTNTYRKQQDLSPVKTNRQLQKAAQYFAQYLADQELEEDDDGLDHEADSQTPAKRAAEHGYEYCIVLENIAMYPARKSYTSESLAKALAEGWQGSEHHRENLLDPDVTETAAGVACNEETGRYYAVQMFGRPKSARIEFTLDNKTKSEVTYEIDQQEFTLKPGVARTHSYCSPPKLVIDLGEDRRNSLRPKKGDVFAVVSREGELRVEQE